MNDWRKLSVDFSARPRPYHSFHFDGPLQPMHQPRKPALLLMLLASFVVGVMIYIGGY